MPRRLSRISLALVLMLSSEVWALGLGEIRLESALNEPLRAEIELLSATPEELANLNIRLAAAETFERYGLDRPVYLQNIQFQVVRSGRVDGNVVELRSVEPMTEPFLTFLVEASWTRGRLLREYTVLLDPPTFAPAAASQAAPAVSAPARSAPADSGRIERAAPAPRAPQPATTQPRRQSTVDDSPYDTAAAGDYDVQRGDTLWRIAQSVRPDNRLSMNQVMVAIFEANRASFGGNINLLQAGSRLRIPSADEIFRISRGDALSEVQRQNVAWGSGTTPAAVAETSRPSLTLVPPDEDYSDDDLGAESAYDQAPDTREQEIEQRINELEAADVPQQRSLIEIRDNELAALREELARIRGEVYEPVVDEPLIDDSGAEAIADDLYVEPGIDDIMVDDTDAVPADEGEPVVAEDTAEAEPAPAPMQRRAKQGLFDRLLGVLTSFWAIVILALLAVGGALLWFMRRGRAGGDDAESWQSLDAEEDSGTEFVATERLRAPEPKEESFVVVEQESELRTAADLEPDVDLEPEIDDTAEALEPDFEISGTDETIETGQIVETDATGEFGSLEDTFSSETAVNLDKTDPIAEADFHMAYGLYDQAADLVNGALEIEPEREDLLTKLCEIYFVWGNRDAFVDAAERVKAVAGDSESGDWDKIVIMGQQIAGDHALFAGAAVAGATKVVDLAFEAGMDETGALDMELIADAMPSADVVDLGSGDDETAGGDDVDFDLDAGEDPAAEASAIDLEFTAEDLAEVGADEDLPEVEADEEIDIDGTAEMPPMEDTVETPTIEQQFDSLASTEELPSLDEGALDGGEQGPDETAEINLDDLGLDVDDLDDTGMSAVLEDLDEFEDQGELGAAEAAALDELEDLDELDQLEDLEDLDDAEAAAMEKLDDLERLDDLAETEVASLDDLDDLDAGAEAEAPSATGGDEIDETDADATGRNLEVDPDATGLRAALSADETGINEALGSDPATTDVATDVDVDERLLDATGVTQVLSADVAMDAEADADVALGEDDATMLAPGYGEEGDAEELGDDDQTMLAGLDDEDDYDFAKTEALPAEVFTADSSLDETGDLPVLAGTDVDLDLDDLTGALQQSESGDTVEQLRDEATVEQPRPPVPDDTAEDAGTLAFGPGDLSDELYEARTMTEVGTKLDLARAYVDMGDPSGARSILEEVLDEGDEGQRQQAQQLLDSLPS